MTHEQIWDIFKANDFWKYDKNIEKESTEGFISDECAAAAEGLYGDLAKLTRYGVQNGFSKCDDEIRDLTKLIAQLIPGTSRKAVNLAKIETKRQQTMKAATYLRKEINMDMVNQLLGNINACISAAEAIMEIRPDNETLCQKLGESKELLLGIKEAVTNAADVTSKEAAAYQVKIFEALMDWREAVSRYNCYSDTVELLKNAAEAAKDWQKLAKTVKKTAKRGVDYYEYTDNCDEIPYIISASRYAERTSGLRDRLSEFRNQTELLYSASALQKELDEMRENNVRERTEINARLAEIATETNDTLMRYQNGEIDAISADMQVSDLDEESAELKERLDAMQSEYGYEELQLKTRLRDAKGGTKVRDKIAKNFEDFVKRIEAYRSTDPAMFVMLCSRIDFNGVIDTLSGKLPAEQVESVYVSVETVIRETERDIKRQRETLKGFEKIQDTMMAARLQEEKILREQQAEREKRLREQTAASKGKVGVNAATMEEEAAAKLARRLGQMSPEKPKVNTNPTGGLGIKNDDK